jgi:hypothetical protein
MESKIEIIGFIAGLTIVLSVGIVFIIQVVQQNIVW